MNLKNLYWSHKMTFAKQLYLTAIIVYSIIAMIISKFTQIHFIHIFNGLMLCSILYNLLDWKYGEEE